MATDYISREAAIEAIKSECAGCAGQEIGERFCSKCAIRMREIAMYSVPAADVRPVVHGTWEGETDFVYADLSQRVICDKCGAFAYFYDKMPMNFCPNCGADMRPDKNGQIGEKDNG